MKAEINQFRAPNPNRMPSRPGAPMSGFPVVDQVEPHTAQSHLEVGYIDRLQAPASGSSSGVRRVRPPLDILHDT